MTSTIMSTTPKLAASEGLELTKEDLMLPESCRMKLPPEIMDMIFSYLPPESVVAVVLTCKTFFFLYFNRAVPIPRPLGLSSERKIRQTFLRWLEQDVAELAYCHYCDRLHPWRPVDGNMKLTLTSFAHQNYCRARETENGTNIYLHSEPYDLGPWLAYPLSFYTAHLAMNAARYGPDHGPSLKDLTVHETFKDIMHRVTHKATWEPRVIDDELFVHGQETFHHMKGSAAGLYNYLRQNAQRLTCKHMVMVPIADPHTGIVKEDGTWRPNCSGGGHYIFEHLLMPSPDSKNTDNNTLLSNDTPAATETTKRARRRKVLRTKPVGDPIFKVGNHPIRSCETCWTDFRIQITANAAPDPETLEVDNLPILINRREPDSATNQYTCTARNMSPQEKDQRDYTITIEKWVRLGPCDNLAEEDTWKTRVHCHAALREERGRMSRLPRAYAAGYKRPGDIVRKWYGVETMSDDEHEDMPLHVWGMLKGARFAQILYPKGLAHEYRSD
ncbi:hypothetical protein V8F20_007105 [Naviculisporaceae sp. PSN 640]